jgi:hypothetical protein
MTDLYFFFKAMINVFWFGITVVLLSELYVACMGYQRPTWLAAIEGFYSWLWLGFRGLIRVAF